jgi:MatE
VSDASEVRVAFLLGSGQPDRARLSAHKSIMISIYVSLYTTSALFICGEDMPTWLTNDPTLQHLLRDLLPLFGFGNAAMTMGTMSWTLLGAQGRYRLATVVVCMSSWFITLPLAAVFSIYWKLNLQGQTAAMFIGYMISGAVHAYYLFRSDWIALSQSVMDDNDSRSSDEESEDGMDDTDAYAIADNQGKSEDAEIHPHRHPDYQPVHQPQVTADVQANTKMSDTSSDASPPKRGGLPRPPSGKGSELMRPGTTIKGEWNGTNADEVAIEIVAK